MGLEEREREKSDSNNWCDRELCARRDRMRIR